MGVMRLIEGVRARKTVSVFSGNHEYLFTTRESDPACPGGFWEIGVRCRPEAASDQTGLDSGPSLFFDSRTNQFLDSAGGLLETLFPISSKHSCDMTVLEQEMNLRVSRYITHNLTYKIQEGAVKYGQGEFDEEEIREQVYVCCTIEACDRLHMPARAFDMEQSYRVDGKLSRTGEGSLVEAYARLVALHLGEWFLSGEVARNFLEDRCGRGAGRQRNYDVICREHIKGSFMEQELEYLMKEPADNMKRAKSLYRLLKAKSSVKPRMEMKPEMLTVSLTLGCPRSVIRRRRGLYYS